MPRLGDMTQHDLEQIGQRYYERLGQLNGEDGVEDAEGDEVDQDDDIYDDLRERYLDEP